jgi:hypothetical protein
MTGHVFHPGHDEWHGQTVVVYAGATTVIGRWDAIQGEQVRMMDVAVHGEGHDEGRDEWVARLAKFGVPVDERMFALAQSDIEKVVRLRDAT